MSDESRWVSTNKTWGFWKGPSCWQSSKPPLGLCGWAFDQEHHHDGIRDGAVIWNGSVLWLLFLFLCLHICVQLSFSAHQVGHGASDVLLA